MERLNFCIQNRQELIQTLSRIPITDENIKDILDLGVVEIIKTGEITSETRHLLQFLKSVLLYKYFPDDTKIRKKFQKVIKKRSIKNKSEQKRLDDSFTLTNEDLEIRKKTIKKLQKIIREQTQERSKQCARVIESEFRKQDPSIGDDYRRFAYEILKGLKEKKFNAEEVIQKIENDEYQ